MSRLRRVARGIDVDGLRNESSNLIAELHRLLAAVRAARQDNARANDNVATTEEFLRQFQEAEMPPVARNARHDFSNLLVALSLHAQKLRHASEPGDSVHTAAVSIDSRMKELLQRLRKSEGHIEKQDRPVTVNGVPDDDPVVPGEKTDMSQDALVEELGGGKCRILVVDDEAVVREVSEEMLTSMGHEVVCVQDGQEAVGYFGKNMGCIDLVLLDLTMPVMNGWDCFRRLKELDPAVKVLLATGHDFDGVAQGMLEEGAAGFIQKPYIVASLSEAVANALKR